MVMSSGNALTIILANVSEYENAFAFELKAYYTVFENGRQMSIVQFNRMPQTIFPIQNAAATFHQFPVNWPRPDSHAGKPLSSNKFSFANALIAFD